jgi:integrase
MIDRHYAPFVEFLFLMDCRPSEAISLQWENIAEDLEIIRFEGSTTTAGSGRPIWVYADHLKLLALKPIDQ